MFDPEFDIDDICSGCVHDYLTGKVWYDIPECTRKEEGNPTDWHVVSGDDVVRILTKEKD